ncbi:hypothetical protein [Yonghaparkia sp. Root332]|uniref:hypothetical protein n=1 Tax=Yonghaparkia sp. Root332 TaxID=1736516 RepID=UPI0006F7D767|nr:hypothetical protein [Yonghaparkia sp. Root332]KQV26671.1 hypothetical protein ASC54_07425 [Yonghaparkia sp. Root332]
MTSGPRRSALALLCGALVIACGACSGVEPPSVSLELVAAERAERLIGLWFDSTQATQRDLRERWPDSPPLQFEFTAWVDPADYRARLLSCASERLGRPAVLGGEALAGEDPWAPAVAEALCRHEFPPFSQEFSLGGPIEARWLDAQLTTALPACVRAFGGRLDIADTSAVIDAIRDRPLSSEGPRDIWSIIAVTGVTALDRAAMRAACPDPALALDRLPLPVIDR